MYAILFSLISFAAPAPDASFTEVFTSAAITTTGRDGVHDVWKRQHPGDKIAAFNVSFQRPWDGDAVRCHFYTDYIGVKEFDAAFIGLGGKAASRGPWTPVKDTVIAPPAFFTTKVSFKPNLAVVVDTASISERSKDIRECLEEEWDSVNEYYNCVRYGDVVSHQIWASAKAHINGTPYQISCERSTNDLSVTRLRWDELQGIFGDMLRFEL